LAAASRSGTAAEHAANRAGTSARRRDAARRGARSAGSRVDGGGNLGALARVELAIGVGHQVSSS
jgi:hypothetical protein